MRPWRLPKPCLRCGGPKAAGQGVKFCDACLHPAPTLDTLIEDQAKELRMGRCVHRQRFGTGVTRARTLSLEALPEWREPGTGGEWDDPVFEEVWELCAS